MGGSTVYTLAGLSTVIHLIGNCMKCTILNLKMFIPYMYEHIKAAWPDGRASEAGRIISDLVN